MILEHFNFSIPNDVKKEINKVNLRNLLSLNIIVLVVSIIFLLLDLINYNAGVWNNFASQLYTYILHSLIAGTAIFLIVFTKELGLNDRIKSNAMVNYTLIIVLSIYVPFVVAINYLELKDHSSTGFIMIFLFMMASLVRVNTFVSIAILTLYGAIYFVMLNYFQLTILKAPSLYFNGIGTLIFYFLITNYLTHREIIHIRNELLLKEKNEKLNLLNVNLELAQKKIEKQNVFLTESNASFKNFAAIAAHDLKSPLRTIAGFTEILSSKYHDTYTEKDKELSKLITKNSLSLQHLIDDILTFSDINKNLPENEKLSINNILNHILETLSKQIETANAKITLPEKDFFVYAHTSLFNQLFLNILSNSIKYRKKDEELFIHISSYLNFNNNLCIEIEDNGIGIEKNYLSKVFEPFTKLHNSNYEGSGLGLSTCKKIVDFYNGTIIIQSELGLGTKTIITFPKEMQNKS
ncbi:MAG: hypothetical protein H6578_08975 [Chitinophagales bacterium]|nr:hypothetical protein [Chitinophagales bacterium]